MVEDRNSPQRPRVEPEIIPPDRSPRRPGWGGEEFTVTGATHRLYVARLGPFGGVLLLLALVALAVIILLALLGALLLWLPVIALIVLIGGLAGLLRLRRW